MQDADDPGWFVRGKSYRIEEACLFAALVRIVTLALTAYY